MVYVNLVVSLRLKCPSGKARIKNEVGKMIPLAYLAQMQLQLACCDMEECDFVEYVAASILVWTESLTITVKTIKRDRIWFDESLPVLRDVFNLIQQIREDPTKVSLLYKNEVTLEAPVKCEIVYTEEELEEDY